MPLLQSRFALFCSFTATVALPHWVQVVYCENTLSSSDYFKCNSTPGNPDMLKP